MTTGTSVIAVKYNGGVVMATDTMGHYGGLARYPDLQRVIRVNETTVLGYSGDIADFQVRGRAHIVSIYTNAKKLSFVLKTL